MEGNVRFDTPILSIPRKISPLPTVSEAAWNPEPGWTPQEKINIPSTFWMYSFSTGRQPIILSLMTSVSQIN